MKRATKSLLALVLALPVIGACDGTPAPDGGETATYHRDAKAVLNRYCNDCHQAGGIGPFALTDYESARRHAPLIRAAVESGRMPPWMPSDAGLPLAYSRKMRAEDKALLARWIDMGMPEGDPQAPPRADLPPLPTVEPPRPDLTLRPTEVYMPNSKVMDDYRCFVIDPQLQEDVWVQAGIVRPDNRAIVHHVLVFEILKSDVQKVLDKDAREEGIGYTCFGGPGAGTGIRTVMGWAPGGVGSRTPGDVAIRIQKGSVLVMQVHYNMANFTGVGDRTETVLELSRTPPKREAMLIPIANPRDLKLMPGDAAARQVINIPVSVIQAFLRWPAGEITVFGNAPHMHMLGTRIATSVDDGPVLLEIPRWNFHWQGSYVFQEPYVLRGSDSIRVECTWDNSAGNPNQHSKPPRMVTWGEGTTDEMCLSYLLAAPGGTP